MGRNNADFQGTPTHLTAQELVDTHHFDDLGGYHEWDEDGLSYRIDFDTKDDLLEGKVMSADDNLFYSIQKHGVRKPVNVTWNHSTGEKILTDGHHRVAVAHRINPSMLIPIQVTHVG